MPGLLCGFGDRSAEPPPQTVLLVRQVHGRRIVEGNLQAYAADHPDGLRRIDEEADALVARQPGIVVGVRTADCVPILLVARESRWAAAVHAGWRGTLAEIVREAVAAARAAGVPASELEAALGPSIGPCCYEVSPELAADFSRAGIAPAYGGDDRERKDAAADIALRPHLDLRLANRILLEQSGVSAEKIQLVGPCTRCAHERYHSYRAEPGSDGRQVSWIGWK
ncbi:MAG TPA: polyphenol oxidase family protein [Candidatus Limnocylindrales bacterium]|nr:polyphenol oxidase family protein [Candidatus Limnocylindrales bacterium]